MNQAELEQISKESAAVFTGLHFGKVFPLGPFAMAIDFYPHSGEYLYINCDPKVRSSYLITRKLKDLERSATHASPFIIGLRKLLSGKEATSFQPIADADKVLLIRLADTETTLQLAIQLGGKRPNIFVLDAEGVILSEMRDSNAEGQTQGDKYLPPSSEPSTETIRDTGDRPLSAVLDEYESSDKAGADLETLANAARKKLNAHIAKRRRLIKNLEGDLISQGNADEWKKYGDLILANVSNIRRDADHLIVTDYFDPQQNDIAIKVDKDLSPTQAAELFFKRYAKARNGAAEISKRLDSVNAEITKLEAERSRIETAIDRKDYDFLVRYSSIKKQDAPRERKKDKKVDDFKGARSFVSSDGFEILVGKKAKDNDQLTFRIARSLDLWLHAADYPGSHVIVRNPNRREVPVQTLTEAAQLAAFYSDAREQPKAAVRYTQKKFVNKPRRAAPGLVSLASFKTILVEPQVAIGSKEG